MAAGDVHTIVEEGLGNASYLLDLGDRRSLVIDPSRDPRPYLEGIRRRGLQIAFAAETHLHNDFVSGSNELMAQGRRCSPRPRRRFHVVWSRPVTLVMPRAAATGWSARRGRSKSVFIETAKAADFNEFFRQLVGSVSEWRWPQIRMPGIERERSRGIRLLSTVRRDGRVPIRRTPPSSRRRSPLRRALPRRRSRSPLRAGLR